jgi:malonyl-CoA O-methyltransferase
MSTLSARDGYRLWAPLYDRETPVSALEDRLVAVLGPDPTRRRLLDVGCGTGRRLRGSGAAVAVGLDASPEMLARGSGHERFAAADVRALPIAPARFDLVWCRLVIGHVPVLDRVYAELARVCSPGGTIIVTDFHPAAAAAGHRRTFRDRTGTVHEIAHYVHTVDDHLRVATSLRLAVAGCLEGEVGPAVRHLYAAAGRLDAYQEQAGLRLVLALAFVRAA